jgi:RNA polymerase sigma-70 factor (ECF subfamily)
VILKSDDQLIAETFKGNRPATQELAERYRNLAFQVAYRALGNRDDAHDVAQESLLYGIHHLGDLRDKGKFSAWIRHITFSRCAEYRRRRGTRRLGEPITLLNEESEELDYAESLAIREALSKLSDSHRTTLLLHYEGGYSIQEVAQLLGVPVNTVRSRLMAAKQRLRADLRLEAQSPKPMPTQTYSLSSDQLALIQSTFPGAKIHSVQEEIEPWMPFTHRVRLAQSNGGEKTVDFREDLTPERAELLKLLAGLGIPIPQLITAPSKQGNKWITLTEPPQGENLLHWALGGTPHRIRLSTEAAFEAIQRLQDLTPLLESDPIAANLPRRTLLNELEILTNDALWNQDLWLAEEGKSRTEWLQDPWFAAALAKTQTAAAEIVDPLVYTDYSFFFPLSYRIEPNTNPRATVTEFVQPFGHFGDPLLGLAMVWVYDCYPFVHTGFVEQFLWRKGKSQKDFAPRLATKALQMIARDSPYPRQESDTLPDWLEQALTWM